MLFFRQRIDEPELMDEPDRVSRSVMVGSLQGIRRVNRYLSGTRSVIEHIDPLLNEARRRKLTTLRLCDIGAGAADVPLALVRHARKRGIALHILAVEKNPDIAKAARALTAGVKEIQVITGDAREVLRAASGGGVERPIRPGSTLPALAEPFHIVTASLFLHHFTPDEAVAWIALMNGACTMGWIVSDLERHPHAWLGFKVLAPFLSRNPVFLHDGALSVRRAYTQHEWLLLAQRARARNVSLRRHWPYRIVMAGRHG